MSAALVLVGVVRLSQGLAGRAGPLAQLGITGIAEVYAWALIGGAAVLTRVGLRRPAVMLALLAALYQCDVTLHTETCVYLAGVGGFGTVAWLAFFVAKLLALARAVRLELSRSATLVAILGATGVAFVPWLLRALDGRAGSSVVAGWLFATLLAGVWTARPITSRVGVGAPASTPRSSP